MKAINRIPDYPESHTAKGIPPQSNPPPNPETTRRLSPLRTRLLWPLTRAGRETRPGYYLTVGRAYMLPARPQATTAERISRMAAVWAIFLWWPIARALTAIQLWRHGIDLRGASGWWQAIAADRASHRRGPAAILSGGPGATHTPRPSGTTRDHDGNPCPICNRRHHTQQS